LVLRAENAMLSFANFVEQMSPINVIIMREQLNIKQRQSISETPAKGGGGLVESCFSSLGGMVAFPGKRPWLACCLQGSVLIECCLKRDSAD
jgi:hypothetical protein